MPSLILPWLFPSSLGLILFTHFLHYFCKLQSPCSPSISLTSLDSDSSLSYFNISGAWHGFLASEMMYPRWKRRLKMFQRAIRSLILWLSGMKEDLQLGRVECHQTLTWRLRTCPWICPLVHLSIWIPVSACFPQICCQPTKMKEFITSKLESWMNIDVKTLGCPDIPAK